MMSRIIEIEKLPESSYEKCLRLPSPKELHNKLPLTAQAKDYIRHARACIRDILYEKDERLVVIVGPCSIHNLSGARDFALRLKHLSSKLSDRIFLVMRAYFEKPRSNKGWRGFITDPFLDGSMKMAEGLVLSRQFLLELASIGLPVVTEFLDPIVAPYIQDLISWGMIGARSANSQIHRQLAASLPMPVGFKNSVDGNVDVAADAVLVAKNPQMRCGIDENGRVSQIHACGNADCHIVLRGSRTRTNYDSRSIQKAAASLHERSLCPRLVIDCSHGNSQKVPERQVHVFRHLLSQMPLSLAGVMLESYLQGGKQSVDSEHIDPQQSVTDPCLSWEHTERLLLWGYQQLSTHRVDFALDALRPNLMLP